MQIQQQSQQKEEVKQQQQGVSLCLCMDIGATRTKMGIIINQLLDTNLIFVEFTKKFMRNWNTVDEEFYQYLQQKNYTTFDKICISSTGDIDTPQGLIRDGHCLKRATNNNVQYLNYPLAEKLSKKFLSNNVFLLNDGHGIGYSFYQHYLQNQQNLKSSFLLLSLGTHPAIVHVFKQEQNKKVIIKTHNSKIPCGQEQTITTLLRKAAITLDKLNKDQYTNNLIQSVSILIEIFHQNLSQYPQNIIICGGLLYNTDEQALKNNLLPLLQQKNITLEIWKDETEFLKLYFQNFQHYPSVENDFTLELQHEPDIPQNQ